MLRRNEKFHGGDSQLLARRASEGHKCRARLSCPSLALRASIGCCTFALLGAGVFAIANEPYNAEAAKLKNPVQSTPESIEAGKKLYLRHCASCHGKGGKGDGGQALSGGEPSDLTDDKWDYGSTDGEIFAVTRDGVSADMLAYKDKLKEKEMWEIVVFVRSIGPKKEK